MGDRYMSADSPRGVSDERYAKLAQETSKGISSFNQLTRSMAQKMSLFGTPQDSRANHEALKDLAEKGNKIVSKINKRLLEISKACQGPQARTRKTQVAKLSNDFKAQVKQFEDTCHKLMTSERQSIEHIRRSSQSFNHDDVPRNKGDRKASGGRRNGSGGGGSGGGGYNDNYGNNGGGGPAFDLNNYNEDQLYAQANIIRYDEDDLARREEDIIHINHQLREVNAAFREIDGLVQDQGEVILEIDQNVEEVKDNAHKALHEVQAADKRKSYCVCSKFKMIVFGGLGLVLLLVLVMIISKA